MSRTFRKTMSSTSRWKSLSRRRRVMLSTQKKVRFARKRKVSTPLRFKKRLHHTIPPEENHRIVYLDFGEINTFSSHRWPFVVQKCEAPRSGKLPPAKLIFIPGAMESHDAKRMLKTAKAYSSYNLDEDTVDFRPTFEFYPCKDGTWSDATFESILGKFVDNMLISYLREEYKCSGCTLSDVLVRRYKPGERRCHEVHVDSHAYITVNVVLSDARDFEGGLFIQPCASSLSRRFLKMEPGDILVHSYDLPHGVHVSNGSRYSLILWFKNTPECVSLKTQPWHDELVAIRDADGLFNKVCANNLVSSDVRLAVSYLRRAARSGHFLAASNLGSAYLQAYQCGIGIPNALNKAVYWLERSGTQGCALAQRNCGLLRYLDLQHLRLQPDYQKAVTWFSKAAEQQDVEAAFYLAECYRLGRGLTTNFNEANKWYVKSAIGGFAHAQFQLALMPDDLVSPFERRRWLQRAAAQRHKGACSLLEYPD
eukprot:TRINITY_DN39791_c0_g1_i1.p1 TRINITY_DN39791_c0_g1~~TRINITY_DN39791_c0_g1_i1.p1  ORF type:complete len:481 (+),score=32.68 TRINITY_DN39791_c0_g1_i1:72-1514(+)